MHRRELRYTGASGVARTARLDLPLAGPPVAHALFAHCLTCAGDTAAADAIAHALTLERIAVLRLDFTGLGEGERPQADGAPAVADLVAAAGALAAQGTPPAVLVGHSLGGTAVLRAAARIPSVKAVVTIASAADDAVRALPAALLVLHSPADTVVPFAEAETLYALAPQPKSLVALGDADHMLSQERDTRYLAALVAAWVPRYIDVQPHRKLQELRKPSHVVARTEGTGFRTEILASGHALVADEPASVGGTELGPTPYDLLAAALGACTGMTLYMYARRKGWPLDEAIVRLTHRKIHVADERHAGAPRARLDHLDRELELTGDLTDEQRRRLLEIADRCPVHKTLDAGVEIRTSLAGES